MKAKIATEDKRPTDMTPELHLQIPERGNQIPQILAQLKAVIQGALPYLIPEG